MAYSRNVALPVLLILIDLALYANTLQASFHFDDWEVIVENPALRRVNDLPAIWETFNTRFLVGLTFAFNYALGKHNVFGYHLFNILCHIASSLLLYALVHLTLRTPALRGNRLARPPGTLAFCASLIFLVHPIQTQAVTYLWQRAASLATFFCLASVVLYAKARLSSRISLYAASLATTLFGMLTKEIAVTIPFMLVLYEFSFFNTGKETLKKRVALLSPFLGTLVVIPWVFSQAGSGGLNLLKPPPMSVENRFLYWLTQVNVVRTYLRLLFFPIRQNLDYDYPLVRHLGPDLLFSFFLLIGILLVGIKIFKRHRLASFGILWFFLTLGPESLTALPDLLFEHRLYLPMVGFSLFLPSIFFPLLKDPKRLTAFFVGIGILLSIATIRRNGIWKEEVSLWQDVVQKSPRKPRGYDNLGVAYGRRGEYEKAIVFLQKAIELNPDYAEAHHDLGIAYGEIGQTEKEIASYEKAIRLKPGQAKAYNNLGVAYGERGEYDKELTYAHKAIEIDPRYAKAYNTLGVAYGEMGQQEKAAESFRKAIRFDPENAKAHLNLGILYVRKKERAGVLKQIETLRALDRLDFAGLLERELRTGLEK